METVVLIGLALVVALVSIDAIARLDERRRARPHDEKDPAVTTTQKIVVDLTKRH